MGAEICHHIKPFVSVIIFLCETSINQKIDLLVHIRMYNERDVYMHVHVSAEMSHKRYETSPQKSVWIHYETVFSFKLRFKIKYLIIDFFVDIFGNLVYFIGFHYITLGPHIKLLQCHVSRLCKWPLFIKFLMINL